MGIPIDSELQKIIDENFGFLDLLPMPTAVIRKNDQMLIAGNSSFIKILGIKENIQYSAEDLLIYDDKNASKLEGNMFFTFSKGKEGIIIPFITTVKKHFINDIEYLVVNFLDLFGEYTIQENKNDINKLFDESLGFINEIKLKTQEKKSIESFYNTISDIKIMFLKEDLSKNINEKAANEYINKYKLEKNTTVVFGIVNNPVNNTDEGKVAYQEEMRFFIKSGIRQTDVMIQVEEGKFLIIFPNCSKNVVENIMTTLVNRIKAYNNSGKESYIYSLDYGVTELDTYKEKSSDEIIKSISSNIEYSMEK